MSTDDEKCYHELLDRIRHDCNNGNNDKVERDLEHDYLINNYDLESNEYCKRPGSIESEKMDQIERELEHDNLVDNYDFDKGECCWKLDEYEQYGEYMEECERQIEEELERKLEHDYLYRLLNDDIDMDQIEQDLEHDNLVDNYDFDNGECNWKLDEYVIYFEEESFKDFYDRMLDEEHEYLSSLLDYEVEELDSENTQEEFHREVEHRYLYNKLNKYRDREYYQKCEWEYYENLEMYESDDENDDEYIDEQFERDLEYESLIDRNYDLDHNEYYDEPDMYEYEHYKEEKRKEDEERELEHNYLSDSYDIEQDIYIE